MNITWKAESIMRAPYSYWLALGLICFAMMVAVSGCGTSETTVSGTVSVDGQALPTGSISFVPVEGTPGADAGTAITEGKYRISKGLTAGKYRIEIQGTRKDPTRQIPEPFGSSLMYDEVQIVPPEYNHESTLFKTVNAGKNTFDFDLKGFQN